jgi:hypothetical protein
LEEGRRVYERFVIAFPWLAKILSVTIFETLVDEVLETMRDLLAKNPSAAAFVSEK